MLIRIEEERGRSVQDGELTSEPGFWCFVVLTPYLTMQFDKETGRELWPAMNSTWRISADDLLKLKQREVDFENDRSIVAKLTRYGL